MGAYWGSRYLAVTTKDNSRVVGVNLMPVGVKETSDLVELYVPEHLKGFKDYETAAEASKAVREWRLNVTENELIENVVAKEIELHEIELLKLQDDPLRRKQKIDEKKHLVKLYAERIKALKAFRRGRIEVR